MNTSTMSLELTAIRSHTRKGMGASFLVHILFFVWLILYRNLVPAPPGIIEITWIESVEAEPVAAPITAAAIITETNQKLVDWRPSSQQSQVHFPRETPQADVALRPQNKEAIEDKLSERLASLQRNATEKHTYVAAPITSSPIASSPLANIPTKGSTTHGSIELARQPVTDYQPIELRYAESKLPRPTMAMVKNPAPSITPASEKKTDYVARRTLAGASLVGPVVDRPLVSYNTPRYPEWAKREAIEASVTLYFVVLPDGRVKENVLIQKTSAFEDFDRNATSALLTWRFEPLQGDATGEQWGLITFHYKLSDA
ncbi:MAG: hypothetical protein AMJ92_04630 [candidate division Zixibacteria bacterium SM23_81]|nr:MAG: hypothetical protein AMJ92_04630 [candidate division Zixibacteria bacterium SM23_81]